MIASKKLFYIDSHNRSSGTHSNFTIPLVYESSDFDHCVVLQASIPKSYYLIQSGRNTFVLDENGSQVTISMPIGNYSRSSFGYQLQYQLNQNSPSGYTYVMTIPNSQQTGDTGLYTWTVTNNGGIQPSFIIGDHLYQQLGFEPNTTYQFSGNTLTSINVVKFQLEDSLFLHSDIANNGNDNVLQEMLGCQNTDYSMITYLCPDVEAYAKPLASNKSCVYTFYLTDEDDREIDLNGHNIVFTLLLFKKDTTNKLVSRFLKYMVMQEIE